MPTTYQKADADVESLLEKAVCAWHPNLRDAAVKVQVLMAHNPEGPAVKHGGYPALATVKPVGLRDRVSKGYDAEMIVDRHEWDHLHEEHKLALLDHELSHLDTCPLSPAELRTARRDDANCPAWKLDDLGRPKLRSVKGDWNAGDGFRAVVGRHGGHAAEYLNLRRAMAFADAARRAAERDQQGG